MRPTSTSAAYTELLADYHVALTFWSEVRALYPADSPEVLSATEHLEEQEVLLGDFAQAPVATVEGELAAHKNN